MSEPLIFLIPIARTEENTVTRRQLLAGVGGLALPAMAEAGDPPGAGMTPARKARLAAARRGLAKFDTGSAVSADHSLTRLWAQRVVSAELCLCKCPAERKAVLDAYVRRARDAERAVRAAHRNGVVPLIEVLEAEFFRADAEALLAEEETSHAGGN